MNPSDGVGVLIVRRYPIDARRGDRTKRYYVLFGGGGMWFESKIANGPGPVVVVLLIVIMRQYPLQQFRISSKLDFRSIFSVLREHRQHRTRLENDRQRSSNE